MLTPTIDRTLLSLAEAVDWLLSMLPPTPPVATPAASPVRMPWERPPAPLPPAAAAHEALLALVLVLAHELPQLHVAPEADAGIPRVPAN